MDVNFIILLICAFCFAIPFRLGLRSVAAGFIATMAVGYFYGIVRANSDSTLSHFTFDFGAIGYYLAILIRRKGQLERVKLRFVLPWLVALAAWPTLLLLAPTQTFLVQLVGLRGHIFFLPFIAIGAMLTHKDLRKIAIGMGVLNCLAFVFALLEVQFGVPTFYPFNAVDQIIYRSTDVLVGGVGTFRIPAIFENSASYGGVMAASLPLLIGGLIHEHVKPLRKFFYIAIVVAAIGVFLCGARTAVVFFLVLLLGMLASGRARDLPKFGWLAMTAFIGLLVFSSSRLQRFLTLNDMKYVKTRVAGSVNQSFPQLMIEYPMGNGLGGGGTSMPYFLDSQVRNRVLIENEYGRILLEQGLPGLALWLGFVVWTITRPLPRRGSRWYMGNWLARVAVGFSFATAPLGTGLLTAIPGTAMLLLFAGWTGSPNVQYARPTSDRNAPRPSTESKIA